MSYEFLNGSVPYLNHIANSGTAFYSMNHGKYSYLAATPFGISAGSAVLAGGTITSKAFDGFVIADPFKNPHIYAESNTRLVTDISAGVYIPMSVCTEPGCRNLSVPDQKRCALHTYPARAE